MSYRTLNSYLKEKFGCKVYKISLSTGCTCPNRDGTKGTGGCTFCSQGGSGDFAAKPAPIKIQIEEAKKRVDSKFPKSIPPEKRKYIAYFQSYTNTYTDKNITIEKLREIFFGAISRPEIVAISIGTRPDCIPDEILELLCKLNKIKPVWIELGLQTIHEQTAKKNKQRLHFKRIRKLFLQTKIIRNRSHCAYNPWASWRIKRAYASDCKISFQTESKAQRNKKFSFCIFLKEQKWRRNTRKIILNFFELEEYCEFVCECLKILPPEIVVHRITGDGPKKF